MTETLITPRFTPTAGSVFARRYKILKEIGRGGMGVVFKASDTRLHRTVALKFLSPLLTEDSEAKERLQREARAAADLDHPNICTIYEIDEEAGQPYISMAFLKGKTLKEMLDSGPMELELALSYVKQISSGLKEAHARGVVHRDVKPANIMITAKDQIKIMDFGLAKLGQAAPLTQTARTMGTPAYMSPEQVRGKSVDHRSDIWSLGCVFYEMLAGIPPYTGKDVHAILYAIMQDPTPSVMEAAPTVPETVANIILGCMAKSPEDRYQSLNKFLTDLSSAVDSIPKPTSSNTPLHGSPPAAIAVLPFVNMSSDPENEYFSDGLSEELINALTRMPDMHVVARTSSFSFKGQNIDVRNIGKKLDVAYVLEGSVRKAGRKIRITAQLIVVDSGYHLWSEKYDREMEDVFAVQDEITEHILLKLRKGLGKSTSATKIQHSPNPDAYDLYLKGRYNWNRQIINLALKSYEQALALDPDFALAHTSLAEAYTLLSIGFDILPSREALPKARRAAERALELDPNLAEAYLSLALIATCFDWDRKAAKANFDKAIQLNPNLADAYMWNELYLTFLEGDFSQGVANLERAQELDPMNLMIKIRRGYMYIYLRDFDAAVKYFEKIVDMEPNHPVSYHGLMDALGQKKMYDKAIEAGEKVLALGGQAVSHLGVLGYYYGFAGMKEKAISLLEELKHRQQKGYVSSFWIGTIHFSLGDLDQAFSWFDKALEERDGNLIYITVTSQFDGLRSDTRFSELLKKMNLSHLLESKPWKKTLQNH